MKRWHVIFHERIYAEHYNTLAKDDFEMLRFVGVNECYEKTIPAEIPQECIVYEKDYPGYSPLYQMNRYYESSVMFHLYKHPKLLDGIEFLGFCQYDMNFSKRAFQQIQSIPREHYDTMIVCQSLLNPQYLFSNPLTVEEWRQIVAHFNEYHKTSFTLENILEHPIVLFHSYGMSKRNFLTMMQWIDAVQPLMLRCLKFDKRHVCGTIERLYGIYITFHILMGTIRQRIVLEGMEHLNEKKFQDPSKSFLVDPPPSLFPSNIPVLPTNPKRVLRIALVAHENMESLIYEYYLQLASMGHVATILQGEILDHLLTAKYDVVHFHNDTLTSIIPKLPSDMNILFTSHSLANDSMILDLMACIRTHRNLRVCVMSEKDKAAYQQHGVPAESIIITPYGVNSNRFKLRTTDVPHNTKTLCLADIGKQTCQHLFRDISDIVCVPSKFGTDNEKYEQLTNYGNSILLSGGENGTPLSIKESLIAGLGVVVSPAVASELPSDWFWVTVVPEEMVHSAAHIRSECEANRLVSSALRQIIRENAKELWDWTVLVPRYVDNIKRHFSL